MQVDRTRTTIRRALAAGALLLAACRSDQPSAPAATTDLRILSIQPAGAAVGSSVQVEAGDELPVSITYSGNGVPTPAFSTRFCLASVVADCALQLRELSVPGLAGGDDRTDETTVTIPTEALLPYTSAPAYADRPLRYRVYACADVRSSVSEVAEDNNCTFSDEVLVLPNFEYACNGAPLLALGQRVDGVYDPQGCRVTWVHDEANVYSFDAAVAGPRTVELRVAQPTHELASVAVMTRHGALLADAWSSAGVVSVTVDVPAPGRYYVALTAPGAFGLTVR